MHILAFEGGVNVPSTLEASILSSVLEDTNTTLAEVEREFGSAVATIVSELSEESTVKREDRKEVFLRRVKTVSKDGKTIRLAAVLDYLRSGVDRSPQFFEYAKTLVAVCKGTNVGIETAIENFLGTGDIDEREDDEEIQSHILALGVPVAELSIDVEKAFLEKYELALGKDYSTNNSLYDRVLEALKANDNVTVSVGGSSFNAMRMAQWLLRVEQGCLLCAMVGNDDFGDSLKKFAKHSDLKVLDVYVDETPIRAVLKCEGKNTTVLKFSPANIPKGRIEHAIGESGMIYMTGIFVHACPDEAKTAAEIALEKGKQIAFGAEGSDLCDEHSSEALLEVLKMSYCIFGLESDYHGLAKMLNWKSTNGSIEDILDSIDSLSPEKCSQRKVAFAYSGKGKACVLSNGEKTNVVLFEKDLLGQREDQRWITDAVCGGFVSQLSLRKSYWECVTAAARAAGVVARRDDASLPKPHASIAESRTHKRKLTLDIIKRLPKAELHLHLDGAVRIPTILELAREQHVALPADNVDALRKLVTVEKDCPSLVEYLRGFGITLSVMQKKYAITRCMYEVCEDAAADGVRYLEVRFSPILHTEEGLSLSGVMSAVCEGLVMAELNLPIVVRIIVCGMRHLDSSVTEKLAEIAWRYADRGVVAFDLAGPEDGFSSVTHKSAFDIVREHMLNCTLHSGEAAGWKSVQDSIRECGAKRIGHGVRMRENSTLLDFVVDHRIPVESCVTSNLQTKAVTSFEEHPFKEYYDKGVVIVPCTDNTTVSGVTLSGEYFLIQKVFDLSPDDIVRLLDYGFRSSFLDNVQKKRLRAEAMHEILKTLKNEGYYVSKSNPFFTEGKPMYSFENLRSRASVYFSRVTNFRSGPHWGLSNPPMTVEIMKKLPKTDLNCRLDGSVSVETLWSLYSDLDEENGKDFPVLNSVEELREYVQSSDHSDESSAKAKALMNSLIQTQQQISMACSDVLENAISENVVYIELNVRPLAHLRRGLSVEDVVETIIATIVKYKKRILVALILFVDANDSTDPPSALKVAKLAVRYRDRGVCGFGFNGPDDHFLDFDRVAEYVKKHNVNVTVAAAKESDPLSAIRALYRTGATRINGGYVIHKDPRVMSHIANYSTALEMSYTMNMKKKTVDASTFAGNVIRLYMDYEVRITICSFDLTLYPYSRSDTLLKVTEKCNLEVYELLDMFATGFRRSYQPHEVRKKMFEDFWDKTVDVLEKAGFRYFLERHYFKSQRAKVEPLTLEEEEKHSLRYLDTK